MISGFYIVGGLCGVGLDRMMVPGERVFLLSRRCCASREGVRGSVCIARDADGNAKESVRVACLFPWSE